ncbi:MAG: hypothetical protein ACOY5F_04055 [Pseudomonadota bacterium]
MQPNVSKAVSVESAGRPGNWRRIVTALLAAMAVLTAVSVCVPSVALAADDDDEEESFETKFIKKLFGINDRDSINYRERPPLVVPPNLGQLPKPETGNVAATSPAWPKDPEVVERKKRAAARRNAPRRSSEEDDRPLTPAELEMGRKAGAGRIANPTGPQDAESDGQRPVKPSELGYKGGLLGALFKDNTKPEVATFKSEPVRTDLTMPPPGYQTPSAAHPYGLTPRQERAKPVDLSNRGTGD